ncbi:hypothetical protein KSP35_07795 [Aquihabitans sp. G128]|uniref:hypothetical protein n=1 Tax=Aquihabitans sp. G128 TaxID=2849779 RepID=UPI001C22485E|nr:hypothetical protein [Aquihabitans sp. G128]QXC62686.1 hypothetical protein KSP35_07795 [Aquihabitans sp. G128]
MTSEPPPRPARRNRPDPAFRGRALGLPAAAVPPTSATAPRESLRSALSRIPDLDRDAAAEAGAPAAPAAPAGDAPAPAPAAGPVAPASAPPVRTGSPDVARVGIDDTGEARVVSAALRDPVHLDEGPADRRRRTSAPPRPPWWRRTAFAVSLVALVVAIPLLGRTGYRLVTSSTDGKLANGGAKPGDPGYEELVSSTPTALLIQKDATTGLPVNLTFLSLGGETGGTVVFIPLDTKVVRTGFGVDRLRTAYSMVATAPVDKANGQLARQTAAILNVGIDQVIQLDQAGWERVVDPVAPLGLDNSDPLDLGGTELPTGPVEVPATQVGPYLAAAREGEDDTARFFRQEQLWRSWLAAVASSTKADAVPGESTTGIGQFARQLAKGNVTYATLPGAFTGEGQSLRYVPDANAVNTLMTDAVPAPDAASPGSRVAVRLLNGVAAADIPNDIIKQVVGFKGTVAVVGNGPSFGTAKTDIVYADPTQKAYADLLRAGLGATGKVRQDPAAPDNIGVTVILGKDLLGDQVATTTTTTVPGQPVFTSSTTTTAPGGP